MHRNVYVYTGLPSMLSISSIVCARFLSFLFFFFAVVYSSRLLQPLLYSNPRELEARALRRGVAGGRGAGGGLWRGARGGLWRGAGGGGGGGAGGGSAATNTLPSCSRSSPSSSIN